MNHKKKSYWRVITSLLFCLGLMGIPLDDYAETPSEISVVLADKAADESTPDFWMPPGDLISVGSHRLHIFCEGPGKGTVDQGNPTVVIDSGLGGFSLEWRQLQNQLADQFRVCTYDRAGYGWSDPGPFPRTSKTIASELKALLEKAGVAKPYILTGHSFGGYNMMYFAKRFPSDVVGLVLIDSSHPDQSDWFPSVYPDLDQSRSKQRFVSIPRLPKNYPANMTSLGFHLMNTRKARRTLRFESMNFEISAREVTEMGELPQIPLAILTRGERAWPDTQQGELNETNWTRLQNELARMAPDSSHVIAEFSGHFIHLDQPLLVKDAISDVVDKFHCSQQPDLATYAELDNKVKRMNWGMRVASAGQDLTQVSQISLANVGKINECRPE